MHANFTVQTSHMIGITQSFKKQWNKTYVQNEMFRGALDSYVDAETAFIKQLINNVDIVFHLASQQAGKAFT